MVASSADSHFCLTHSGTNTGSEIKASLLAACDGSYSNEANPIDGDTLLGKDNKNNMARGAAPAKAPALELLAPPKIIGLSVQHATEGSNLICTVSYDQVLTEPLSQAYSIGGGSASPADYGTPIFNNGVTTDGSTLVVPDGVSSFTITLPTVDDAFKEPTETVPFTFGLLTISGNIYDNDTVPAVDINSISVDEAAGTADFTVRLTIVSDQAISVDYASSNGSAMAGSDYTAVSGTLNFAVGEISKVISVPINDDDIVEGNEAFTVTLSNPSNVFLNIAVGTGTIVDNEIPPTITLTPPTLPNSYVGVPYNQSVTAQEGIAPYNYAISAGALPTNLTLNPATGAITGIPVTPGTFNFTVTATDSSPGIGPFTGSRAYSILVSNEVDLEVLKACPTDMVAGSGANNYLCTITVTNKGPVQATGVSLSDTLEVITGVSDGGIISVSQGTPSLVAGQLNWNVGALDPTEDAVLVFARSVSLQAAEGSPLITNTASVTGNEPDTDDGNNSATANTNVRWPTATFEVIKEYASSGAGPVDVTLECADSSGLLVYEPQSGPTTAALTVRRFDIDPAGSGTACTVTESVPAGYYQAGRSADCDVEPTADGGEYTCTLTNALTRATFRVTKHFADDNNLDEVTVSIDCNTGLILDQDKDLGDNEWVEFVVTDFTEGVLECLITEDGKTGYSGEYQNLTITGAPVLSDDSCFYDSEEILGNSEHECVITNSPDPVQVTIHKEWIVEGTANAFSAEYEIELYCGASNMTGPGTQHNGGNDWNGWGSGDGDGSFTWIVTPLFPSSVCAAYEHGIDSYVEVDNPCDEVVISAGNGAECTITNTVYFEGIPTLSQYGMAILALLMLGIGVAGFRRFS